MVQARRFFDLLFLYFCPGVGHVEPPKLDFVLAPTLPAAGHKPNIILPELFGESYWPSPQHRQKEEEEERATPPPPGETRLPTQVRTRQQVPISRAGHATTLPRHRDHVFRPQSCWLLHYYYIPSGISIHTRRPYQFSSFFLFLE